MEPTWTVRQARAEDVGAIVGLSDGLFREDSGRRDPTMNHGWAREHGEGYFGDLVRQPAYLVLVAEAAGELVGYLAGLRAGPGHLRMVPSAELESMFVAPAWRGRGVGAELARAFLAWAREHGAAWVQVTAYSANAEARAFYERLGFGDHSVTLGMALGGAGEAGDTPRSRGR